MPIDESRTFKPINIALLTVSDTRSAKEDTSGDILAERIEQKGRACAVVARGTYIFALPGSNGAVKDGWDGILDTQLDSRHRPCNFVELIPRLLEK